MQTMQTPKQGWTIGKVACRYAMLASVLVVFTALWWIKGTYPGAVDPLSFRLHLIRITLLGPLSIWEGLGFGEGLVIFSIAVGAIATGFLWRRQMVARLLGYLGIVWWFFVGCASAALSVT